MKGKGCAQVVTTLRPNRIQSDGKKAQPPIFFWTDSAPLSWLSAIE